MHLDLLLPKSCLEKKTISTSLSISNQFSMCLQGVGDGCILDNQSLRGQKSMSFLPAEAVRTQHWRASSGIMCTLLVLSSWMTALRISHAAWASRKTSAVEAKSHRNPTRCPLKGWGNWEINHLKNTKAGFIGRGPCMFVHLQHPVCSIFHRWNPPGRNLSCFVD